MKRSRSRNDAHLELLLDKLSDPNPDVRHFAAKSISKFGRPVLPVILDLFSHRNWLVRQGASTVLSVMMPESKPVIDEMLSGQDSDRRYWAIKLAGQHRMLWSVPQLIRIFKSWGLETKAICAESLGLIANREAIDTLFGGLSDPDWQVRKICSDGLVRVGPRIRKRLIDTVIDSASKRDPENQNLFYWSTRIIGELRLAEAADIFFEILDKGKSNSEVIIQTLGKLGGQKVIERLANLLSDDSWTIRKVAAQSLCSIGESAIPVLLRRLRRSEKDFKYWVVRIIGDINTRATNNLLEKFLSDKDWFIRSTTAYYLGENGFLNSIPKLVSHLYDKNLMVRKSVNNALLNLRENHEEKFRRIIRPLARKNLRLEKAVAQFI